MRTAICLSGQPRNQVRKAMISVYKHIIEPNNCDVFVCSNSFSLGIEDPWYDLCSILHELNITPKVFEVRSDTFLDYEHVAAYSNFPNGTVLGRKKKKSGEESSTRNQGSLQQVYYIEKCNKHKILWEKDNKFVYDCVVKCRIGLEFFTKLDLSKISIEKNKVYMRPKDGVSHYVDCFAFGDSKSMDVYSNRFSVLIKEQEVPDWVCSTENQMEYILLKNNIKICTEDIPEFKNVEQ